MRRLEHRSLNWHNSGVFIPKGLNINNPGLSDEGAIPREMETQLSPSVSKYPSELVVWDRMEGFLG